MNATEPFFNSFFDFSSPATTGVRMYAKLCSKKFTRPLKGIDRLMFERVTGERCLYTLALISPRPFRPETVPIRVISEIESEDKFKFVVRDSELKLAELPCLPAENSHLCLSKV